MLDRLTQPPTRDAARVVRDLTDLVLSYPAAMADQTALIFLDARGRESSSCLYAVRLKCAIHGFDDIAALSHCAQRGFRMIVQMPDTRRDLLSKTEFFKILRPPDQ